MDRTTDPQRACLAAAFFSAADRPVQPLSFSLSLDRNHAHSASPNQVRAQVGGLKLRTTRFNAPTIAANPHLDRDQRIIP